MVENGFISMAAVIGIHGVRGELKVRSFADDASIFQAGGSLLIKKPGKADEIRCLKGVRAHQQMLLFSLEGLTDRDQARDLIGAEIWIAREQMPELEKGTYYWFEIIGLDVYQGENDYLGRIREIIPTGSNEVYVVRDGRRETLVPALQSVIVDIDLREKRMRVNLPKGL